MLLSTGDLSTFSYDLHPLQRVLFIKLQHTAMMKSKVGCIMGPV